MSIEVRYKCGHGGQVSDQANVSPVCPCGERQIVYVKPSRMPRFTGSCMGPYATHTAMEPLVVNLAPAGPLKLKEG